jgi:hypothetical protein
MAKSSQIAWKLVPIIHFFPLKVVPLIEVLLYSVYPDALKRDARQASRNCDAIFFIQRLLTTCNLTGLPLHSAVILIVFILCIVTKTPEYKYTKNTPATLCVAQVHAHRKQIHKCR